jgi:hypothetical protein
MVRYSTDRRHGTAPNRNELRAFGAQAYVDPCTREITRECALHAPRGGFTCSLNPYVRATPRESQASL